MWEWGVTVHKPIKLDTFIKLITLYRITIDVLNVHIEILIKTTSVLKIPSELIVSCIIKMRHLM